MAASIRSALARLRREDCPLIAPLITPLFEELCRDAGHLWRDRVFNPLVTLRVFLLQILHGNTAINHLRQLSSLCFSAGSYCDARIRLPLGLLQALLQKLVDAADQWVRPIHGSTTRIYLVDGSSFSMPNTPAIRERFGMSAGKKIGVGYLKTTMKSGRASPPQ